MRAMGVGWGGGGGGGGGVCGRWEVSDGDSVEKETAGDSLTLQRGCERNTKQSIVMVMNAGLI